jgi:hypothetical protein
VLNMIITFMKNKIVYENFYLKETIG